MSASNNTDADMTGRSGSTASDNAVVQRPQRRAAKMATFVGMDPEDPEVFLLPGIDEEAEEGMPMASPKRKAPAAKGLSAKKARITMGTKQQAKPIRQAARATSMAGETSASDVLSELSSDDNRYNGIATGILAQVQNAAAQDTLVSTGDAALALGSTGNERSAAVVSVEHSSNFVSADDPFVTSTLPITQSAIDSSSPADGNASSSQQPASHQDGATGGAQNSESAGNVVNEGATTVPTPAASGGDKKEDGKLASEPAKPKGHGKAPVTATSRAALADTLPYFRAYQGGAYTGHGMVTGFYLGECTLKRPHFDGDVIITRCGGHHGSDGGTMRQISDVPANDAQVRRFKLNMATKTPLVMILGKSNQRCLIALTREFNVMGWFQVTDVWSELNDGHVSYLYRLERVRRPGNSAWWIPIDERASPDDASTEEVCRKKACSKCSQVSKQVYSNGWICLNRVCKKFWKLGNRSASVVKLRYNPDFLRERSSFPEALAFPYDLCPPEPELSANEAAGAGGYDRRMWKGFTCADCKHISPRRKWTEYECDLCNKKVDLKQPPVTMSSIRSPHALIFTGHASCVNNFNPNFIVYSAFVSGWFVFRRYDLGHGNSVFHIQSNEVINKSSGGPDDMLMELQTDRTMDLQRRSMGNKTGKSEGLVNHFSQNFGFPYKYIVAQKSTAFKDAPSVILRSLERCQWIAEQALGKDAFDRFNELLAVGYMENGSMGYHDDGEAELGDTVVAMCIGGDATMKVRMKDEYYKGFLKGGTPVEPVLRVPNGALMADERRKLTKKFAQKPWDSTSKAAYSTEFDKIVAKAKAGGIKLKGEAKPILELKFRHGDFFIMNGPDVQKYYEHGVAMDDKLRFALTARHIRPEEVDKDDRHLADRDSSAYVYDGATDGSPPSSVRADLTVGNDQIEDAAGLE